MSLIATRLQNWRVQNPEFDRNMTRPCEYGALDFFIEQTNAANSIINPKLRERAFASMGNTVQIPVINYDGDVTVGNVRSCVIRPHFIPLCGQHTQSVLLWFRRLIRTMKFRMNTTFTVKWKNIHVRWLMR